MTPDNFLALESRIKAAIRAALGEPYAHVHVLSAAELEGVREEDQLSPAVHVLYRGFAAGQAGGSTMELEQFWSTVVVVRNLADDSGEAARGEAGRLVMRVIDALLGRDFDIAGVGRIEPAKMQLAPGFRAGHMYLPVGWQAPMTLWRQGC